MIQDRSPQGSPQDIQPDGRAAAPTNPTVLVSVEPGLLGESLHTLLASIPFVTVVGNRRGARPLLADLSTLPAVVIFECAPPGRWLEALRVLHAQSDQMKIIAITDRFQTSRLAVELGAAAVLYYGFSSHDLQSTLQQVTGKPAEAPSDYYLFRGVLWTRIEGAE